MRKILIILFFIIKSGLIYTQITKYINTGNMYADVDSLPIYGVATNDDIFVLGIYNFDTLVSAVPDVNKCSGDITNIKYKEITIEKQSLNNLFLYEENETENFNYLIFSSIGYGLLTTFSNLVWDFVLPNVPTEYAELIKKTYPKKYSLGNLSFQKEEEYGCYKIRQIDQKKFLCLLMKLSFYNTIREKINPHNYIFKDSKFEEGLYIKVLIPLKEE